MEVNWFCIVCGAPKLCTITHYENGVATMQRTDVVSIIKNTMVESKTDVIEKVFCSECGLLYDVSSVK